MGDVARLATQVIEQLERGEVSSVWDCLVERLRDSIPAESLGRWVPGLDEWIGSPRRIAGAAESPDPTTGRLVLEGPAGRLSATVRFDDDDRITGLELAPVVIDGIRNIVIGSPGGWWNEGEQRAEGEPRQLGEFYAELLGMRILRQDWIKVGKDGNTHPHLAFGDGWSDQRPPRWPDPDYPHQLHLDLFVGDIDAAHQLAVGLGASKLQDQGGYQIFADPVGHPFCLYPDPEPPATPAPSVRVGRVVFDCSDPADLARFYADLLDMRERIEDAPERVVIGRADGSLPVLAFQQVADYVPPRWHDPAYPEQVHLDLQFNDLWAAQASAERLGAIRLPPPIGSCAVYADPAGHPFCLCSNAGGSEPYVVEFLSVGDESADNG